MPDLAYTLATGRETFAHRFSLVAASSPGGDRAAAFTASCRSDESSSRDLPVAFLFPGQGAQFPGMGRQLYASEPVFRAAVDACAEILRPLHRT